MLISAGFQSHRHSQGERREGTHIRPLPRETACVTNIGIFITLHLRHVRASQTNFKRYLTKLQCNVSMNIEWRHSLPQWSRTVIAPCHLRSLHICAAQTNLIPTHNPSLKCSPAQTGGEKSASAAYRKSLN